MKEQEAIETIKYASAFNADNSPLTEALHMAIKALKKESSIENVLERLEKLKKYESTGDCPKDGLCRCGTCETCYTDTAIQIIKEELMAAVNSNE